MIIHSYLTDGFFDGGKMFLESFKKHNGQKHHIILDVRGLTQEDGIASDKIHKLYNIYKNLTVNHGNFDYDEIAKEFGISGKELREVKEKVESKKTKVVVNKTGNRHQIWGKQYISVDDRYNRAIHSALSTGHPVLHIDIDTYFRGKIDNFVNVLENNDVSLIFRLNSKKEQRKIFGTMVGINNTMNGRKFHTAGRTMIENNPITTRKHMFGQRSLFELFEIFKDEMQFGDFGKQNFSKKRDDKQIGTAKKDKIEALEVCKEDFK